MARGGPPPPDESPAPARAGPARRLRRLARGQRKRIHGFAVMLAPQAVGLVVGLLLMPVILAHIPKEDYGRFQFAMALQAWVFVFTGGNILTGARRGIARGKEGTLLYAVVRRLRIILAVAAVAILGLLVHYLVKDDPRVLWLAVFAVVLAPGRILPDAVDTYLVAHERFGAWAAFRAAMAFLVPATSALIAVTTEDVFLFAAAQWALPVLVGGGVLVALSLRHHLLLKLREGEVDPECYAYGLKMIAPDMVSSTSARVSHLLMGDLISYGDLAVFGVASRLRERVATILKFPRDLLYSAFARHDLNEVLERLGKLLGLTLGVGVVVAVAVGALGVLYIRGFLPEGFADAGVYFMILCAGLPAVLAGIVLQTAFEAHLRARELSAVAYAVNLTRIAAVAATALSGKVVLVVVAEASFPWILLLAYVVLLRRTLRKA